MSIDMLRSTADTAGATGTAADTITADAIAHGAGTGAATTSVERIHADHHTIKRLGHWTEADHFEVRARGGSVVLDLRSPRLPAEIEIRLRIEHAMVKLLLPDGAVLEHWDLAWTGRGKVKDAQAGSTDNTDSTETQHKAAEPTDADRDGVRRVRLVGTANASEIRVNRGGVAMLTAMCSREYLADLRQAHKAGTYPTIDDPARALKEAA